MRYWISFMTVQWVGPLLIELKKEKKKIFGRRKIVPILHPNICDWVITSSHVKMCTITFIEVTSHWVGTIDSIFAMILWYCYDMFITLQESGGGAVQGELSALSIVFDVFTAAPDNSLCFQMFSSRSSSLKLFISLVYLPLLLIQQNLGVSMEWHKYTGPGQ